MKRKNKSIWLLAVILFLTLVIGVIYVLLPSGLQQKSIVLGMQSSQLQTIAAVTNKDHIKGNPKAKITVIEYSDYECPTCQDFQPTLRQILNIYGSNIKWIVRHYPLPQHINAEKEAEASECANEIGGQNALWKYNDLIFSRSLSGGTGFPLTKLVPLATEVGLNKSKFQRCLNSGKYAKHIQENIAEAQIAGIHQLPSTVIIDKDGNRQLLAGNQPYSVFQAIFDNALTE